MTAPLQLADDGRPHEVFISYSRKDQEVVRRLDEELRRRNREAWVDWEGIRPSEEFIQAIFRAIEGADTFVFVLSPDSVVSQVCGREIAHAAAHNKRMVPIVVRDVEANAVPEPLAKLNWIFARGTDDFTAATDLLVAALDTDLPWIHAHTRLLTRALEWEANGRSNSFVLRGEDLRSSERWLAQAGADKERQPTALQTEYIIASRKAAARRQRVVLGAVTGGAVVAIVLAIIALQQRSTAVANAEAANRNATEAARQRDAALKAEEEATRQRSAALKAEEEATRQRNEAIEALSRSYFSQGTRLVAAHQTARAMAFFSSAVRRNGHLPSAARIATLLTDRVWPKQIELQRVENASRAFFSSNGAYVVAVLPNGFGEIRPGNSAKRIGKLIDYHLGVGSAYFSPDGERVVITTGEGKDETRAARSFQLWECKTGRPLTQIFPCAAKVYEVTFSPDSNRFALCAEDATYLCDLKSRTPRKKLDAARTARFSGDGSRLVTAGESAQVWDALSGAAIGKAITAEDFGITVAALSSDGTRVATGLTNDLEQGAVRVWEAGSGKALTPLQEQNYDVDDVIFSRDNRWILSVCRSTAQVFDAVDGKAVTPALAQPTGAQIMMGAFSLDGGRIVVGGRDGSVCVWDIETGQLAAEMWEERALATVAFSEDGRAVVTTSNAGKERRTWNVLGGIAQPELLPPSAGDERTARADDESEHTSPWRTGKPKHGGVSLTPDGRFCLLPGENGSVNICDAVTRESKRELHYIPEDVTFAEFSPDGTRVLVSVSNESRESVGLWNATTGEKISAELIVVDPEFERGGSSPDGARLVLYGENLLRILDTETGKEITPPLPMTVAVRSVWFSPDSSLFATAGDELQIWNAQQGRPFINALKPPRERAFTAVAFSRDNRRFLASTVGGHHEGDQSSAQLFDTETAEPLSDSYESHGQGGEAEFTPEERGFIDRLGNKWKWDLPPADPPPKWLASLAETIAGQRLSDAGVLEPAASNQVSKELRDEIAALPQEIMWAKLGEWALAPPERRTVAPGSTILVREFVDRALAGDDNELVQSAARTMPEDGRVQARLGLRALQEEEEFGQRAKLRAEHQTFLALKLSPESKEVATAREKVLRAVNRPPPAEATGANAPAVGERQE